MSPILRDVTGKPAPLRCGRKDAVNFALRTLAAEPLGVEEARAMRGSGWEGDLDELRETRSA